VDAKSKLMVGICFLAHQVIAREALGERVAKIDRGWGVRVSPLTK